MTGESRLADLQCVYQFTHAQFPAPESSNNANACRIYDSLPKGGKVSHYLLYIGICRYIKRDVNHEKDNADRLWRITWSWDDDAGKGCGARVGGCLSVRSQNSSGRLRLNGTVQGRAGKRKESRKIISKVTHRQTVTLRIIWPNFLLDIWHNGEPLRL